MKLECLFDADSLDELAVKINAHFGVKMRVIRSGMSLFEQYEIRPEERVFVPGVWRYRIVAKNGKYSFGVV